MGVDLWAEPAIAGVLGLLLGSFLNVVIHRLPKMMERQWAQEHAAFAAGTDTPPAPAPGAEAAFNLWTPRSRCPSCGHVVQWYENIPVLSYLFLRGRCSACYVRISARYPLVEILTAALFAFCAYRWGLTPTGLAWCGFSAAMVALAFIDWDTTLLPDDLTLPLLWAGLIAAAMGWTLPLPDALWGAVAGYLSLWSVYWLFKLTTGKEGMGHGDFKLLAALGAWLGWPMILPIVLGSSVIGAVVGIGMKVTGQLREGVYVPYGPFLAGAGLVVALAGSEAVLGWMGWA